MAVYVDPIQECVPNKNWKYDKSCHMFADTLDELHEFALSLGLKLVWFQDKSVPHYDLTVGKRAKAVDLGAVSLDRSQTVQKWRELGFLKPGGS